MTSHFERLFGLLPLIRDLQLQDLWTPKRDWVNPRPGEVDLWTSGTSAANTFSNSGTVWFQSTDNTVTLPATATQIAISTRRAEQAVPDVQPFDAVPALVEAPDVEDEYLQLAKELGLESPGVNKIHFLRFLQREEIPVYDQSLVDEHLQEIADSLSTPYSTYMAEWMSVPVNGVHTGYRDVIPVEALRIISRVNKAFSDSRNLAWQIGCVKMHPDPFLAACYAGERFTLYHWDEPGFSVTKAGKEEQK